MHRTVKHAVVMLTFFAAPIMGFQNRDDGVITVGRIVAIDTETQSFELESVPLGLAGRTARPGPVNGEVGIGDIGRIPPPGTGPTVRNPVPVPPPPRPRTPRGVPVIEDGAADRLPTRDRRAEGLVYFQVGIDEETALIQDGQAIAFDALRIGDRISVTGKVAGDRITAYRIERQVPEEPAQ